MSESTTANSSNNKLIVAAKSGSRGVSCIGFGVKPPLNNKQEKRRTAREAEIEIRKPKKYG